MKKLNNFEISQVTGQNGAVAAAIIGPIFTSIMDDIANKMGLIISGTIAGFSLGHIGGTIGGYNLATNMGYGTAVASAFGLGLGVVSGVTGAGVGNYLAGMFIESYKNH